MLYLCSSQERREAQCFNRLIHARSWRFNIFGMRVKVRSLGWQIGEIDVMPFIKSRLESAIQLNRVKIYTTGISRFVNLSQE
jgi:hypothetical protein